MIFALEMCCFFQDLRTEDNACRQNPKNTIGDSYDFDAGCDDPTKSGYNQRSGKKCQRWL